MSMTKKVIYKRCQFFQLTHKPIVTPIKIAITFFVEFSMFFKKNVMEKQTVKFAKMYLKLGGVCEIETSYQIASPIINYRN